jgi:hypothetical protein
MGNTGGMLVILETLVECYRYGKYWWNDTDMGNIGAMILI